MSFSDSDIISCPKCDRRFNLAFVENCPGCGESVSQTSVVPSKGGKSPAGQIVACRHCDRRFNPANTPKCPRCFPNSRPRSMHNCSQCGREYNKVVLSACPICEHVDFPAPTKSPVNEHAVRWPKDPADAPAMPQKRASYLPSANESSRPRLPWIIAAGSIALALVVLVVSIGGGGSSPADGEFEVAQMDERPPYPSGSNPLWVDRYLTDMDPSYCRTWTMGGEETRQELLDGFYFGQEIAAAAYRENPGSKGGWIRLFRWWFDTYC